jgi:hypothetical protein
MRVLHQFRGLFVLGVVLAASVGGVAQETYFPTHVFGRGQWAGHEASYNSFLLKKLEEPSLFTKARNPSAEAYRFLWFPSFHSPLAVRMDVQSDGTSILTIKMADGHAGFPRTVTKLATSTTRTLSREQTDAFRTKVKSEGFWHTITPDKGGPAATDGDGWIVEGVCKGRYHIVSRAVPNTIPKNARIVQTLGRMLAIDLAQLEIPSE